MHNILVPIGVSKYAKTTLLYALEVARHFESTIYVIDAYPAFSSLTSIANVSAKIQGENVTRIKTIVSSITSDIKNSLNKHAKIFAFHTVILNSAIIPV